MAGFIAMMTAPVAVSLVLVAMHGYLGGHVVRRGVIFVDIALAQVSAFGVAVAMYLGAGHGTNAAWFAGLAATFAGALLIAATRGADNFFRGTLDHVRIWSGVFWGEPEDPAIAAWIAYPLASLVGLSRINVDVHWASDVFAGAALGWAVGKAVVSRRDERARQRATEISFYPSVRPSRRAAGILVTLRF